MGSRTAKIGCGRVVINHQPFVGFVAMILFLSFLTHVTIVLSYEFDLEDDKELFKKLESEYTDDVAPYKQVLSNCQKETGATDAEVEKFMKKEPQTSNPGKCYVTCILKNGGIIKDNSINVELYMKTNIDIYGEDHEITRNLKAAVEECLEAGKGAEMCERASSFNDCMNLKTHRVLDAYMDEGPGGARGPTDEDFPFGRADELVSDGYSDLIRKREEL